MRNHFLEQLVREINLVNCERNSWVDGLGVVENTEQKEERRLTKIERLKSLGVKVINDNSTFYTIRRSRNCISCMKGDLGPCVQITNDCNLSCDTCYQDNTNRKDPPINLREMTQYIGDMKFRGASITGGEPLLRYKRLLTYLRMLKPLGVYTHMYTNGALLTENMAKKLGSSGLNEMRFNLAASNFNVIPQLQLAQKHIPVVAVEIPAVPGDENKIKSMLLELDRIGVYVINLDELIVFPHNVQAYKKKGFLLKGESHIPHYIEPARPIYGSEEICLNLLEFAKKKLKRLSVHFCSYRAKVNFQHCKSRQNIAAHLVGPHDTLNNFGFIEKVLVYEPNIAEAQRDLKKARVSRKAYSIEEDVQKRRRLVTDVSNIKHLRPKKYDVGIYAAAPFGMHEELNVLTYA